jgi:hypothetical protein
MLQATGNSSEFIDSKGNYATLTNKIFQHDTDDLQFNRQLDQTPVKISHLQG